MNAKSNHAPVMTEVSGGTQGQCGTAHSAATTSRWTCITVHVPSQCVLEAPPQTGVRSLVYHATGQWTELAITEGRQDGICR